MEVNPSSDFPGASGFAHGSVVRGRWVSEGGRNHYPFGVNCVCCLAVAGGLMLLQRIMFRWLIPEPLVPGPTAHLNELLGREGGA